MIQEPAKQVISFGGLKMDKHGKQTISCDVKSCKYNDMECSCSLSEIRVTPKLNCKSKKADESVCSSYCCKNC